MQPSPCLSGDDRGRESFGGFNSRRLHQQMRPLTAEFELDYCLAIFCTLKVIGRLYGFAVVLQACSR